MIVDSTPAAADSSAIRFRDPQIEMAHGAGGKLSRRLIEGLIAPAFANAVLQPLADSALFDLQGTRVATTADAYVVKPLRFNGGSIGELAINGTVNDLAVAGAHPVGLMATFILEAGLTNAVLRAEVEAMALAARRAGVAIFGGDTKVVEHGMADGMYISTFGIGRVDPRANLGPQRVRPGDAVLLSGPIGDHGITILLARGELELETDLASDTRPVTAFVGALLDSAAEGLHWMRDPTRGGVATALNELARDASCGVILDEESIPLRNEVRGACEILGLDPLHIANEGQLIAIVADEFAEDALAAMRAVPGGEAAARIGEIQSEPSKTVLCVNGYGGTRVVDMLVGDPLPRIC
ncbi:MAG: hydrogenase expression/formation protein HypE [Candidatus Eremiobacteraeota bacterium]|nr:hydrogenase expression/formation protein HypE [Candidatus Eremiobacteraeota bacterium]